MNGLTDTILQMMDTMPEQEDYMGGRTDCCTVGNAINQKKPISRKAGLYSVVTGTRLNVTAAGQNVKNVRKKMRMKNTVPKWNV